LAQIIFGSQKGVKVYSNEEGHPSSEGDNSERTETVLNLKKSLKPLQSNLVKTILGWREFKKVQ
jgi:hypothetical protein